MSVRPSHAFSASVAVFGWCIAAAGIGTAGCQAFWWFRDGFWDPMPVGRIWFYLTAQGPYLPELQGVETITSQVLQEPLSPWAIGVGFVVFALGVARFIEDLRF